VTRLAVVVPSRGRPKNIERLASVFVQPWSKAELHVVIDSDDPEEAEYEKVLDRFLSTDDRVQLTAGPRKRLIPTLNEYALHLAECETYDHIGFMGDDHLPRTKKWDTSIADALDEPGVGIVYGDDLLQGEMLPTAVFMRASIVRALGYFAPPRLVHLFADNAWKTWGQRAGCLKYLPVVTIEHLHFLNGKAPADERYAEVNSGEMYNRDQVAYRHYEGTGLAYDVKKIKAVMA
jgi:hypothetical protein